MRVQRSARKLIIGIICVLVVWLKLFVQGESGVNEEQESAGEISSIEEIDNKDEAAKSNEDDNLLTQEQMLEDYYYMWETLNDSSFAIEAMIEQGVDVEEIFLSFEESIKSCKSDREFYAWINMCLRRFEGIGHVGLVNPNFYKYMQEVYNEIYEGSEWTSVLNDEETNKMYDIWREILGTRDATQVSQSEYAGGNVNTKILEEDRIAYIHIDSFLFEFIEEDHDTLVEFYDELEGFEHLIIDIQYNGGGSDRYWEMNIVEPLLRESVSVETHLLHKITDKNKAYFEYLENGTTLFEPIEEFSGVEVIDQNALQNATHYFSYTEQYEPVGEPKFKGEIWVLIGEGVYSSSDTFAMFCERTGFATLVGEVTRGNGGGGFDSAIMTLPNSRLLVRYSLEYTINSDGSNNQLYGTKPHITSANGEEPLETCLRVIGEGGNKGDTHME